MRLTCHAGGLGARLLAAGLSVASICLAAVAVPTAADAAPPTAADATPPNAGDVWVKNVGQSPDPGHQMDPHLDCADINLWGNGLNEGSGDYTIDSWPPTGGMEQVYADDWSYNTGAGGSQVTSVIDVKKLVANAVAAGAVAHPQQGIHFKLQFVQNPQKHKVFWVACMAATAPPVVDFSHACGLERVTVINPGTTAITVTIWKNGSKVATVKVAAGSSKLTRISAVPGDVFTVKLGSTMIGTDTYKRPVRCTT